MGEVAGEQLGRQLMCPCALRATCPWARSASMYPPSLANILLSCLAHHGSSAKGCDYHGLPNFFKNYSILKKKKIKQVLEFK